MIALRSNKFVLLILGLPFPLPLVAPGAGMYFLPPLIFPVVSFGGVLTGVSTSFGGLVLWAVHMPVYLLVGYFLSRFMSSCRKSFGADEYSIALGLLLSLSVAATLLPLYGFEGGESLYKTCEGFECI